MDPALLAALAKSLATPTENSAETPASSFPVATLIDLFGKLLMDDDEDEGKAEKLAHCRQRAWKKLSALHRKLGQFTKRNAFVAGALGACECWGADASCARCGGEGMPGWFEPVPRAFEALVVPLATRRPDVIQALRPAETVAIPTSNATVH